MDPGLRRGTGRMKPINPWPYIIMLAVVIYLIIWML
jgi:hypothetical protein